MEERYIVKSRCFMTFNIYMNHLKLLVIMLEINDNSLCYYCAFNYYVVFNLILFPSSCKTLYFILSYLLSI